MIRLSALLLAFFISFAGAGSVQANAIQKQMQSFAKVFNAGDAGRLAQFYTANGALLPPKSTPVVGRKAIAGHFANAFKAGVSGLKYQIVEIEQTGPVAAVEIGETLVKFKSQTVRGRYLHVWKKVQGRWLIHRDIFHVLKVSN